MRPQNQLVCHPRCVCGPCVCTGTSLLALPFVFEMSGWGCIGRKAGSGFCVFTDWLSAHLWRVLCRSMSLSTIAILNSVKKAVESNSRRGHRSIGVLPFTLNSESLDKTHHQGKSPGSPGGSQSSSVSRLPRMNLDSDTEQASFSFLLK